MKTQALCGILILTLCGCAHSISIAPDPAMIGHEAGSPPKIQARVGYYISSEVARVEVVTPGGGGDSVQYAPYRDLEVGFGTMLRNVFLGVTKLNSPTVGDQRNTNNIGYIITPSLITNSSSPGILTWPPTQFSVDLTCKITDTTGKLIASPRVVGNGHYEVRLSFAANHGTAGKLAMEDALQQMQRSLHEINYEHPQSAPTAPSVKTNPSNASVFIEELRILDEMHAAKRVTDEEYRKMRASLVEKYSR